MFEAPRYGPSAVATRSDAAPGFAPFAAIDFRHICSVLWRGKTTILLAIVLALGLAAAFVLLAPRKYTATTQLLVDPMELRAVPNELISANQQSDAAVLMVESQVSVLTSDNVLRRVVESEGLDRDPEFSRGALAPKYDMLTALNALKQHLVVKRAERTYVVDVSVTSVDPAKAARLANAIAQAYLAEQIQVRADAARQVSQSLSARLKELQDRVREAEERVETYKADHNIVDANGELVNEQQLADINGQLIAARARTVEAKARLDQVESVRRSRDPVGAFPAAVQSPTITALRAQYAEVMRREAEQKTSLGDRHPAVIEIEAQAERLQKMIDDEVNRIALAARAEYESAKANEDTLSHNLDTLKNTALNTDQSLVGLRELEREVQANRAVYEAFLVRARETGEQEQVDTKNIRVISKADLPLRRSSPPPTLFIALAALMLGAGCGTGVVFMRESYRTAGPRPDRRAAPPSRFGAVRRMFRRGASSPDIPVLARLPHVDVSFGLDALHDPHSQFASGINKVYQAMLIGHGKRDHPTVLLAACDDEDDTAAVALTLAAAAAVRQRVLLIDADLKRRTLAAIDADQGDAGLVDVAVGRRELAEVIVRDRETNINTVSLVAPNSRRDRPISDADIQQAFDKTKRFDLVIVAAVDFGNNPSARFFAGLVDDIVLVARADERDARAVERFMSQLGADAPKVRGVVLTGADGA